MYNEENDVSGGVTKITTVEDYIKKVAELQGFYSDIYGINKQYGENCKEKSLMLIKEFSENTEFYTEYNKFKNNLEKFNIQAIKLREKLPAEKISVAENVLSDKLANMNRNIIEDIKEIDNDFFNTIIGFFSENSNMVKDINEFCLGNIDFLNSYLIEILKLISTEKTKEDNLEYFFRGQYNAEYSLLASVFRGNLKGNESTIVNNTLADRFDEFSDCKTMYEKLVKMQHYQIPTRVMDLTTNSLTALYFACETNKVKCDKFKNNVGVSAECHNNKETDGAVFLFSTNMQNVAYPDSDRVRILSNMSRLSDFKYCNKQYNLNLYNNAVQTFYRYLYCIFFESENDNLFIDKEKIGQIDLKIKNENRNMANITNYIDYIYQVVLKYAHKNSDRAYNINELINTYMLFSRKVEENRLHEEYIDNNIINNSSFIIGNLQTSIKDDYCDTCNENTNCSNKLTNLIREEKPGFEPRIKIDDMSKWLIVKGAKNNARIKIQDGHFIIVPKILKEHKKFMPLEIHEKEFDDGGYEKLVQYKFLKDYEKEYYGNNEKEFENVRRVSLFNESFIHKIVIDADKKEEILEQLAGMGITKATIYPELSSYGEYVKEKYSK